MSCDTAEFMDINGCSSSPEGSSLISPQVEAGSLDAANQLSTGSGLSSSTTDSLQHDQGSLPQPAIESVMADVNADSTHRLVTNEPHLVDSSCDVEAKHIAALPSALTAENELAEADRLHVLTGGHTCSDQTVSCTRVNYIEASKTSSVGVADGSVDESDVGNPGGTLNSDARNAMTDLERGTNCTEGDTATKVEDAASIDDGCKAETEETQVRVEDSAAGMDGHERLSNDLRTEDSLDVTAATLPESSGVTADPMMGFDFNEEGMLCDQEGRPFEFNVSDNHWENQKRYERLGEAITEKIYELLVNRCKLKRINLPLNAKDDEPHSFIFMSDGAMTTFDRLMILIHGSGVVRAGQWARRLIMNDDLEKGTQIPYIERALRDGYEVIVFNTNLNAWPDYGVGTSIPENESPEAHASYVWKNIIRVCVAKHIAIVAHSYGGIVTTHLLETETEEFKKRVFAVGFTDSVHSCYSSPQEVRDFYKQHARNYVTSELPVGEPVPSYYGDDDEAERVSAGHTKHEWTSYSSFGAIFEYFERMYQRCQKDGSNSDENSALCTAV